MQELTVEYLIELVQKVDKEVEGPLTRDKFIEITGIKRELFEPVLKKAGYKKPWTDLVKLVGIERHPSAHGWFTKEEACEAYYALATHLKHLPTLTKFDELTIYKRKAINDNSGGKAGFLEFFKDWLIENKPNSPLWALFNPESKSSRLVRDKSKAKTNKKPKKHTEIQHCLIKLGVDLGLNFWVATNDKGREYQGVKFSDMKGRIEELPVQFDRATQNIIELIDVLWLEDDNVVAAFEIEDSTKIYSGLLRMSDLVAKQPYTKLRLFIVAPDDRRKDVLREINRPTFTKMQTPLPDICKYISYSELQNQIEWAGDNIHIMKMDFIDKIAERCNQFKSNS